MDTLLIKKAIKRIFPTGSEIAENCFDVPSDERFWLIPGNNGPRWLIPQEKKYSLPVFKQWRPYKLSSIVKWKVLSAVYSAGQFGMLPGVRAIGISGSSKNVWRNIGWEKETRPIPVFYFGTPSKNRKLVTLLLDSKTSQPDMVAKIPLSEYSMKFIEHEFRILCDLQQKKINLTPRPLFFDKKTGIAAQKAISGYPTGRKYTILHHKLLGSLKLSNKTISLYEKSLQLRKELASLPTLRPSLRILINDLLENCTCSTKLSPVYVHGDFTPWNIMKVQSQSLFALDWEMGDPKGLPLYDFFYFFLIQSYLFNGSFNPTRIIKLFPDYQEKYPLAQILKFTAASIGLRLAKEERDSEYLENFLRYIKGLE